MKNVFFRLNRGKIRIDGSTHERSKNLIPLFHLASPLSFFDKQLILYYNVIKAKSQAFVTMRSFFSIHVAQKAAEHIIDDLPKSPGVLWYPSQNLHITVHFVGDVMANEMLKLLKIGEDAAKEVPSFLLRPTKIIFAEDRIRLAIEPHPGLIKLHDLIAEALKSEGLGKPDESPYFPHITLGRVSKTSGGLPEILPDFKNYEVPVNSFGIFLSEQGANNMGLYTLFKEFTLS